MVVITVPQEKLSKVSECGVALLEKGEAPVKESFLTGPHPIRDAKPKVLTHTESTASTNDGKNSSDAAKNTSDISKKRR